VSTPSVGRTTRPIIRRLRYRLRSMAIIRGPDGNTNGICLDGAEIRFAEGHVYFSGVFALRHPDDAALFLRQVHLGAVESNMQVLTADITDLKFISASCIRLLIVWVGWILHESVDKRYIVCFKIKPGVAWQSTTTRPIRLLAPHYVTVSENDPSESAAGAIMTPSETPGGPQPNPLGFPEASPVREPEGRVRP
jgi:hypothetical protein